jgi:hypothetical protein
MVALVPDYQWVIIGLWRIACVLACCLYAVPATKIGISARHLTTAFRMAINVTAATWAASRIRKSKLGLQQGFAKRLRALIKPITWKFRARLHGNPGLAADRRL